MMASGGEKPKIDGGSNKVMVTNVALSTLPYAANISRAVFATLHFLRNE
jgi:hypothetical protein